MLYVGIDVAKNKHDVTVIDNTGKMVLKPITITNRKQGFELLHNTLKQLNQNCLIAMEDTGHYALNLLTFLHQNNYQIYTYNPLLIKEFTKSLSLRKTKTDKKDARTIALKLLSDPNRALFMHDNRQEELKIMTRHMNRLKKHQSDWKVQYTKCLDIIFPELHQVVTKHSDYVYELLKGFPSPEKMVKRGSSHLRWALIQAAIKVARYSPTFKAYFRTKLAQGKHYNVAISHVAKKLIRVLFHLLQNNEAFEEDKLR